MAVSSYKVKQQQRTKKLVQELIAHTTGFDTANQNFKIAEDFALHNLEKHTFPEPNEDAIRRQYGQMCEKFFVHNQAQTSDRLKYLDRRFRQMPLKQEGISKAHDCVLALLFELAERPDGWIANSQKLSKRKYTTLNEWKQRENERLLALQLNVEPPAQRQVESEDSEYGSQLSDYGPEEEEVHQKQDEDDADMSGEEIESKKAQVKNKQAYFGGLMTTPDTTKFISHSASTEERTRRSSLVNYLNQLSEVSTQPRQTHFDTLEEYLDIRGKQTETHHSLCRRSYN